MPPGVPNPVADRCIRKIRRRLLPFIFILYMIALLDRANIAYTKSTMIVDLGFSEAVFGLGAGLFFLGYFLFELPGALIVERWSARWWIARILTTWGICTLMIGLARTSAQFYFWRFLLGAAEAGFFPGVVVYLSHWFPSQHRARAVAGFAIAGPVALTIGGPLAGLILKLDWLDLTGWRWVFILEGLPAILFGFITPYVMTDRPQQATWLGAEERQWLCAELEEEGRRKKAAHGKFTAWQAMRQPTVLIIAFIGLLNNIGMVAFLLWLPTMIQKASRLSAASSAVLSGVPFAVAVLAVIVWSWSSDRTGRRLLHTFLPLLLASCFFSMTAIPEQPFAVLMICLCMTSAAVYSMVPSFFVLPTLALGGSGAAAAIGLITSVGALGGFVGPPVVGYIVDATSSFTVATIFLSASFMAAAALTLLLRGRLSGDPSRGCASQAETVIAS